MSPSIKGISVPATETEHMRFHLVMKVNEYIESESTISWGQTSIKIPDINLTWQSDILASFDKYSTNIETQYQQQLTKIIDERNRSLAELECKALSEVREKLSIEKNLALKSFCDKMLKQSIPSESKEKDDTTDNTILDITDDDITDTEGIENVICSICQDTIIRKVKLTCSHSYCWVCMKDYVQDKIDSVLSFKKKIEDLCVLCPNCRCPYLYLDELDGWLYENGFNTIEMWKIQ